MSSKFNCLNSYAATSRSKESKETKFQKYLHERNQKLLEKCFNIKPIQSAPLVVVAADMETTKATETEPVALTVTDKEISIETESTPVAKVMPTKDTSNEKMEISKREKQSKLSQAEPNEFVGNFSIETKSIKTKTIATKTITTKTLETKPKSSRNEAQAVNSSGKSNQMHDKDKRFSKKPSPLPPQRHASSDNIEFSKSTQIVYSVTRSVKVKKTKSTVWRSYAITTTSSKKRSTSRQQQYSPFDYDLSREEQKFAREFSTPMKPPAEAEMELLKKGQRKEYLTQRYEHSPVTKYNYPEATSWRIGWLQRQPQSSSAPTATPVGSDSDNKLK